MFTDSNNLLSNDVFFHYEFKKLYIVLSTFDTYSMVFHIKRNDTKDIYNYLLFHNLSRIHIGNFREMRAFYILDPEYINDLNELVFQIYISEVFMKKILSYKNPSLKTTWYNNRISDGFHSFTLYLE